MAHEEIPSVQPIQPADDFPVARRMRSANGPSGFQAVVGWMLRVVLVLSLLANAYFIFKYMPASTASSGKLTERFHSGNANAASKIAIVRIEGTIVEGLISFASQQIKDAARDDDVKAVVVVVNSPGGTVTASDQLWKQIKDLRDGKSERQSFKKPVVVSMESVAASGGYYIAAPAERIFAQPTTVTGSIGVYASFLDLHEFAQKYGVTMNTIKKGELKGGSMFHAMKPEERREWEDLLEHTYQRFMAIVKEGRDGQKGGPRLKYGLRDEIQLKSREGETFVRRLADGGVFNADQARDLGLVDQIGYLEDAIQESKKLAGLTEARVVSYDRPFTLLGALIGIRHREADGALHLNDIPGVTRRLWLLTPGYELSGIKVPQQFMDRQP